MVKRLARKAGNGIQHSVGKVRRFTHGKINRGYVRKRLALRRGECLRCGACCRLLFKCPLLLEHADGTSSCRIHDRRPENCRIFPLDPSDLADRDRLEPLLPCGFYFVREPSVRAE